MIQNNLFSGFIFLCTGLKLVLAKGFRQYTIIPVCINSILIIVISNFFYHYVTPYLNAYTASWPVWLHWLVGWLIGIVYWALIAILFGLTFTFFTTLFASPFYALLAEKISAQHQSQGEVKLSHSLWFLLKAPFREFRKWLYTIPRLMVGGVFFLIPVTTAIAPVVWFIIFAWIASIQFIDYGADNDHVSFTAMLKQIKPVKWTVLGFGMAISLGFMIPGINLIMPAAAVAGGTVLWLRVNNSQGSWHV